MKRMTFVILLIGSMFLMMFAMIPATPAVSVTSSTNANPVIKIGGLGPLAILPGKDMQNAMKLAISDVNSNGGVTVGGKTYDLQGYYATTSGADGLPDSTTAGTSLTTLKGDGVVAMIGGFRTEVTISVQSNLGQIPFLGVGSTAPIITPYFWRVGPTNGSNLAESLIEFYHVYMVNMGIRNITVVRENADWSLAISNGIKGAFAAYFPNDNVTFGNDIAISTSASQDSVTSSLTPLKNSNTQALLELFSAPVGQFVTQAWASLNMTQMLAGINVQAQLSSYFQDTAGASYGEIELETTSPHNNRPQAVTFRDAYTKKYGTEPTYTAYATYDAVNVIVQALKKSSDPTSAQIQTNLASTNYNGTSAVTKFTNNVGPPQYGVNSTGQPAQIPGVDYSKNITVHDLFTTDGVGTSGGIYANPVFVQWQKGGVKKEVYSDVANFKANGYKALQWPINHSDSGYTSTQKSSPGFEFLALFIAMSSIIVYKKHKKNI